MKVGQHGIYDAERIAGVDEEIGFAVCRAEPAVARLGDGVFESSHGGGADGHDTAALVEGAVDLQGGFRGDGVVLFVEAVIFDALDTNRLKGAQSDVQSEFGDFYAPLT